MDSMVKYGALQVILHWISALLLLLMLVMGAFVLTEIPNSSAEKIDALRGHVTMGIIVLVLTVVRVILARVKTQPAHLVTGNVLLDKLGVLTHFALNIVTILVALSGIGIAVMAGLPDILFAGQGSLPESFYDFAPRIAHGILTKLLVVLIILHTIGALYHHFMLKDGIFKRMSLRK